MSDSEAVRALVAIRDDLVKQRDRARAGERAAISDRDRALSMVAQLKCRVFALERRLERRSEAEDRRLGTSRDELGECGA